MLNEAAGLPRVLRSLAALEPPPAEVLAVDGGSTDASVAIAEAAGLLVVRHETRGRAAAINRGVQEATAPIICVLHADTLLGCLICRTGGPRRKSVNFNNGTIGS
jgi:glycosyltransferase involved in cell wall biosynthesis